MDRAYRRAKDLIQNNISVLHRTAEILLEKEQMDGEELQVSSVWWGRPGVVAWWCWGMVSSWHQLLFLPYTTSSLAPGACWRLVES